MTNIRYLWYNIFVTMKYCMSHAAWRNRWGHYNKPEIPQGNSLISWSGGENVFGIRVEWKAVYFGHMSVYRVHCLNTDNFDWNRISKFTSFCCFSRMSQIISFLSSATDPNIEEWCKCQATSSTTPPKIKLNNGCFENFVWTLPCPLKVFIAWRVFASFVAWFMSHRQIVWSSDADKRYPS